MSIKTPSILIGALALSTALLCEDSLAQISVGTSPGRRGRGVVEDGVARQTCFHRLSLSGNTCDDQATDFVVRYATQLGVAPSAVKLGKVRTVRAGTSRSRSYGRQPQLVHGFVAEGYGLTYGLDEFDRIRSAHGVLSPDAAELPPPSLLADDARELALGLQGLERADFRAEPVVHGVARHIDGELRLLQRVTGVKHDFTPLAIELDAYTGLVVRVFEHRYDGKVKTGTHTYDDVDSPFDLGKARGYVYKRVKHALAAKDSFAPLKNFSTSDSTPLVGDLGMMYGRYAQVFNADGVIVTSAELEFPYTDDDATLYGGGIISGADLFDHSNTYQWFDSAGTWVEKSLGTNPLDRTMPVYVNEDVVNAFFSPTDPDGDGAGFPPGFFLFGDFGDGSPEEVMHDFSRDPSVVIHEYMHGVVDGLGATFGSGGLDTPERAVNEALADFGAAAMLNDPKVGQVLAAFAGADLGIAGDSLRDLEKELTFQDDLFSVLGLTTSLPEEHAVGELFGAYLWRARAGLKKSATEMFLVDMLSWPQSSAEVGFPTVTVGNAEEAFEAFLFGCVAAAMDDVLETGAGAPARRQRQAGTILGAALAHGLAGQTDDSTYVFDGTEGLNVAFKSAFLGSLDEHAFDVDLEAGQSLAISATGRKGTAVDVTFSGDDFELIKPKKTNGKLTSAKLPKIVIGTTGTYRVSVSNPGSEGGDYILRVKAK